jgi:hypothetical protein
MERINLNNKGLGGYKQELIGLKNKFEIIIDFLPPAILLALAIIHFAREIISFETFVVISLILLVIAMENHFHREGSQTRSMNDLIGVVNSLKIIVETNERYLKSIEKSIPEEFSACLDVLKWTISIKELQQKEKHVERNVCIFLATVKYEQKIFTEVIIKNLEKDIKYTYFIADDKVKDHILKFVKNLKVDHNKIIANLTIIPIKLNKCSSAESFCNLALYDQRLRYDPDPSVKEKSEGYLLPDYADPEKAIILRLDRELCDKLSDKMTKWKKDPKNKPIDLATYLKKR